MAAPFYPPTMLANPPLNTERYVYSRTLHPYGLSLELPKVMSTSKLERWASIIANVGVLIGIIFLVIEIRTNTESNIISTQEARAGNLVDLNLTLASSELAAVWVKAAKGEELTEIEDAQMTAMWRANLSQANLVRRLFDRGVVTEDELAEAWRGVRGAAQENQWVRSRESGYSESYRVLIFEEDGVEKYAQMVR